MFARAEADGVPARVLRTDKEALLLELALHPERTDAIVAEYVTLYAHMRAQPGYPDLAIALDRLTDLPPDAPEIEEAARRLVALVHDQARRGDVPPTTERVFRDWGDQLPPAHRRLMERMAELLPEITVG